MVNEERVKLMTKCAIYEKNYGKTELPMAGYFKRDYVKLNILKTMLCAMISYGLCALIYIMADYENLFMELNQLHFRELLLRFGVGAVLFLAVYYAIARVLYAYRFAKAKRHVTDYYRNLKKLKSLYKGEEDISPKTFEEGGDAQNDEFIDY